ncbi:helix-turn-helix transcriptional regulator [Microbispora sp. H10885]|uniref:helix-turn-helix transcriptional regulator n=1 Tax=Microbispora sp. H10885 TaxID=2729110 RepID=UPI0015FF8230|nr:LuxR family transcriptional regulator [Microbispora sp. H10885]
MDYGPSLLERDAEVGRMRELFAAAARGQGGVVLIEGPAGIGKSALAGAARRLGRTAGCRVLGARGSRLEQRSGYGVLRQLVEPVLLGADTAQRVRLLRGPAHRALALLDSHLDGPAPGDPGAFHVLYRLLVNVAKAGPVALVVDDVHWADDPSLRVFLHMLPGMAELPLAMVLAGRPAAAPGPCSELAADPAVTVLRPAPLTPAATARLVRAVNGEAADTRLCAACHRLTGGNPLFVRELAAAAAAAGGTAAEGDEEALRALGGPALSQWMGAVLAHLTPDAVRVAQTCAVLGEEADPQLVAELAGGPETLTRGQDELVAAGVLRGGGRPEFVHALTRHAVYSGIAVVERSRLHRRAAELLAAGQPAPLVATHLLETLPSGDAWVVDTLVAAANHASSRGAPRSALAFLERALQEPPTPQATAELVRMAGRIAYWFDWPAAIGYLRRAAALAPDAAGRAEITELLARAVILNGRNADAIALLENALTELGDGHAELEHRLRTQIIAAAVAELDLRHTGAQHLAVLSAAPRLGDEVRCKLDAFTAFRTAVIDLDRDAAVSAALRVLRLRSSGMAYQDASSSLPYLVLIDADHDDALRHLDHDWSAAREAGSSYLAAPIGYLRVHALLSRGHLAEAEAGIRQAVRLIGRVPVPLAPVYGGEILAEAHLAQGRPAAAAEALARASAEVPPYKALRCRLDLLAARVDLAHGRAEQAVRQAEQVGRRLLADGWLNPASHPWRMVAALGKHVLGTRDAALALAAEDLDLARRWGAPRTLGRALRVAATVTGGRAEPELLEEAVRVLRTGPARLELATALHAFGRRTWQRHPQAGRAALAEALRLAEECGAAELARRARTALSEAGTRPPEPHGAGLTPGEWRVARLAARGRTNRQIAQELNVTPKTVETHLGSVYRKLGVRNRTAMARALAATDLDRPD